MQTYLVSYTDHTGAHSIIGVCTEIIRQQPRTSLASLSGDGKMNSILTEKFV